MGEAMQEILEAILKSAMFQQYGIVRVWPDGRLIYDIHSEKFANWLFQLPKSQFDNFSRVVLIRGND